MEQHSNPLSPPPIPVHFNLNVSSSITSTQSHRLQDMQSNDFTLLSTTEPPVHLSSNRVKSISEKDKIQSYLPFSLISSAKQSRHLHDPKIPSMNNSSSPQSIPVFVPPSSLSSLSTSVQNQSLHLPPPPPLPPTPPTLPSFEFESSPNLTNQSNQPVLTQSDLFIPSCPPPLPPPLPSKSIDSIASTTMTSTTSTTSGATICSSRMLRSCRSSSPPHSVSSSVQIDSDTGTREQSKIRFDCEHNSQLDMTTTALASIQLLLEKKANDLNSELHALESSIERQEDDYIANTWSHGNVIRGWESFARQVTSVTSKANDMYSVNGAKDIQNVRSKGDMSHEKNNDDGHSHNQLNRDFGIDLGIVNHRLRKPKIGDRIFSLSSSSSRLRRENPEVMSHRRSSLISKRRRKRTGN